MAEHHTEARKVPADPDDPDVLAAIERARSRRPLGPGEERVGEHVEWIEFHTIIEDVKGVPAHVVQHRWPMVSGRTRVRDDARKDSRDG